MGKKFKTYLGLLCIVPALAAQDNNNFYTHTNPALVQAPEAVKRVAPANMEENENQAILSGQDFKAVFEKESGMLVSYQYKGKEYISGGLGLYPYLQVTQDSCKLASARLNALENLNRFPKAINFETKLKRGFIREPDPTGAPGNRNGRESQISYRLVECTYAYPEIEGELTVTYTIYQNGMIKINNSFTVPEKILPAFSNIGMRMLMPSKFNKLVYCGKVAGGNQEPGRPEDIPCQEYTVNVKDMPKGNPDSDPDKEGTVAYWFALMNKKSEGLLFIAEDSLKLNFFTPQKSIYVLVDYPISETDINKNTAAHRLHSGKLSHKTVEYGFNLIPLDKKTDFKEKIKRY